MAVLVIAFLAALAQAQLAYGQTTARVSVGLSGAQADGPSWLPTLSADGRFVAFSSSADNLVPGDTNAEEDVFVHDRQTGVTTRVSISSGGAEGNRPSFVGVMSANGRFVVFSSEAANFVPGDTNDAFDAFVHDRQTGDTVRVSVRGDGGEADGHTVGASLTPDGRFVVLHSLATNLVPGDTNGAADFFVRDRQAGTTERVSVATGGGQANDDSDGGPSLISSDGRFVVFSSKASNLVANDTNGVEDIFVHDRQTGTTTRVNLRTDGRQSAEYSSYNPSISADGRFVTFTSGAALVGGTPGLERVYVRDLQAGVTSLASISTDSEPADVGCPGSCPGAFAWADSISGDGRFVAFTSRSSVLVPNDTNDEDDVFVRDRLARVTLRVSVSSGGTQGAGFSYGSTISQDGQHVAFVTSAALAADDTSGEVDVYVHDLADLDTDDDTLPDAWETRFGLNPSSTSGGDGASGDPDGDGRTNAQELEDGTHPRGLYTRYFAEGATSADFFDTRLALLNVSTSPASVLLRFLKTDGSNPSRSLTLGSLTRGTVDVNDVAELDLAEFSTVIESDQPFVADRTMTWDSNGYGSHAETSVPTPATTWYLAEGATHSGFNLFYLIQNPNTTATSVEVTYLLPAPGAPIVLTYAVPARSRFNIWVDLETPALASTDVSAILRADLPIIVERAMYLDQPGKPLGAGHESAGITTPATQWFLAEGATGDFFDLFVLVANPGDDDAAVTATFLFTGGATLSRDYLVKAKSRFNIWVDTVDPKLRDADVSTVIDSTNGVPIIVERAMWWPGPTAATWAEAHNSAGLTSTGRTWALAEGEQGGVYRPTSYDPVTTYILIANRGAADTARVTLYYEDGTSESQDILLEANSRTNVPVGLYFPNANGKRFGAIVEALGPDPQIVVERAMYSDAQWVTWAAGTNTAATKLK